MVRIDRSQAIRRALAVLAAGAIGAGAFAGIAGANGRQGQVPTSAVKGYVKGLPPDLVPLYATSHTLLGPSAYRAWKPEKKPWTICFNNSYLGNTWRAVSLQAFNALVAKYRKAGLVVKGISTDSNENVTTQIQQMRDMIDVDHCSGIITIPTGTSGMDGVIKSAYDAGIPVVDDLGPTTSPYAENFDENFYTSGLAEATFLAKAMGGKGSLLDVIGIPGETLDLEYQAALHTALKKYPGIHIIGQVTGEVTNTVAQSAVLQFLSTHPEPITGVFQEGGMGIGIYNAFEEEKRPIPAIVEVGTGGFTALWHELIKDGKRPKFYELTDPPIFCMNESFNILVRILEGQHPKNMTIFYTPPAITASNVTKWWKPGMTKTSTTWPEPPVNPLTTAKMNAYFTNGKAPL